MMSAAQSRVGEVDGNDIDYMEFSQLSDRLTIVQQAMTGRDALTQEEQDQVRNMAWDELVNNYAIDPGFVEMGLIASEAEQVDMVDGEFISPVIQGIFVNPQTGVFDPAMLRNFVANLNNDPSGRSILLWEYFKEQMVRQRVMAKYVSLVSKGMYTTTMEVNEGVALSNQLSAISYVSKGYNAIADSTITVSEADARAFYKEHEELFRQQASRDIEYILYDVLPSPQDYADAERTVNQLAEEFRTAENPIQYAAINSQTQHSNAFVGENQVDALFVGIAFGEQQGEMYGPVLEGDTYTLARVGEVKMLPDSIGARHILLEAGATELADSIEQALKGGANFAALSAQYSLDEQANLRGGELGVFPPEVMVPEFSDAAMAVNPGQYFRAVTRFGIHVGQLTSRTTPVKKVQIARITYNVEPSSATQQAIYNRVSQFMLGAAGSYDNFTKMAADSSLLKRAVRIADTDRNISGINNSREVVRWAFNAEPTDISPIMEIEGDYLIAALTGATESGIAPFEQVKVEIAQQLRKERKGEMIAAELATATSLDAMATQLGEEVKSAAGIDFNAFFIDGLGVEPALIGASTVPAVNTLSKPAVGESGVFLFEVTERETLDNVTAEAEAARIDANTQAYIGERVLQALLGGVEINDYRVKFF